MKKFISLVMCVIMSLCIFTACEEKDKNQIKTADDAISVIADKLAELSGKCTIDEESIKNVTKHIDINAESEMLTNLIGSSKASLSADIIANSITDVSANASVGLHGASLDVYAYVKDNTFYFSVPAIYGDGYNTVDLTELNLDNMTSSGEAVDTEYIKKIMKGYSDSSFERNYSFEKDGMKATCNKVSFTYVAKDFVDNFNSVIDEISADETLMADVEKVLKTYNVSFEDIKTQMLEAIEGSEDDKIDIVIYMTDAGEIYAVELFDEENQIASFYCMNDGNNYSIYFSAVDDEDKLEIIVKGAKDKENCFTGNAEIRDNDEIVATVSINNFKCDSDKKIFSGSIEAYDDADTLVFDMTFDCSEDSSKIDINVYIEDQLLKITISESNDVDKDNFVEFDPDANCTPYTDMLNS